ncbi:MAG: sigma-70 family RNA polymerase sigma factor [Pseudomonadota bacterium]
MAQTARGDRQAFQTLVDRHLGRSLVIIRGFQGLAPEAEDVAQEAFTKLWVKAPQWQPPAVTGRDERQALGQAGFRTWFHRLLINHCIDRQRRLGRRRAHQSVSLDDAPALADDRDNPSDQLLAQERDKTVHRAMGALPERQRLALTLCAFEGHSNAAAAEIMGIGVKALEALLVRGRRQLRTALTDFMANGSS